MGYGKTLQMITIMVENAPERTARNRTTLIVVPTSLVNQWLEEMAKHLSIEVIDEWKPLVYMSGHRPLVPDVVAELRSHNVVITTYSEVMRNYPKCEPPLDLVTEKAKDEWWANYYEREKGPLLSTPFYRIILDEAQAIKNHESRTSKACRLLTAKYRWVLSGTPITNNMEELYAPFDFLGVEGAGSYTQFKTNYAKRNDTTMQRLDAMLRKIMMRRTGSDRMFGAPLVSLPELDYNTVTVPFNSVERVIYLVVRARFIAEINRWSAARKVGELSKNILVMLTRLRQMTGHVLSISSIFKDLLKTEDVEKLWKVIERHTNGACTDINVKTAQVLRRVLTEARSDTTLVRRSNGQNETIDLTINDSEFDFRGFFQRLQADGSWDAIRTRSTCASCSEVPLEGRAKLSVPCFHLYCDECLNVLLESAKASQLDSAECMTCHGPVTGGADLSAMDQAATEAGAFRRTPDDSPLEGGRRRKDADEKWLRIPGVEKLSTKIQAVTSTIEEWLDQDSDGKIVVFALFVSLVKVLGRVCTMKGWGYEEYMGKQSRDTRNQVLQRWKDPLKGQRVLLMSMRAGGLGLNLTEASYVIIIDPWWNTPVEDQAFSRVYRIGQRRRCLVRRFLIQDSIDTQLMQYLQKTKALECDRVMDGRNNKPFDMEDLMRLFGPTRRDPVTGQTVIDASGGHVDEFVQGSDTAVVDYSDVEDTVPAPARPREPVGR